MEALKSYTVRNNFRCGIGKARSGKIPIPHRKYRYHIDVVSEKTDVVSVFPMWYRKKPMWYRKKPMWYRYFRCGIGNFPLRAFPIPHRKLFLTVYIVFKYSRFHAFMPMKYYLNLLSCTWQSLWFFIKKFKLFSHLAASYEASRRQITFFIKVFFQINLVRQEISIDEFSETT